MVRCCLMSIYMHAHQPSRTLPAFLGALADFLDGVLAILIGWGLVCVGVVLSVVGLVWIGLLELVLGALGPWAGRRTFKGGGGAVMWCCVARGTTTNRKTCCAPHWIEWLGSDTNTSIDRKPHVRVLIDT